MFGTLCSNVKENLGYIVYDSARGLKSLSPVVQMPLRNASLDPTSFVGKPAIDQQA
jgi:hypothetical protein